MCKAIDDMRKEERKEGRMEGREEGRMEDRIETVIKMSNFGMTKEDIAKCLGMDINKITCILKEKLA